MHARWLLRRLRRRQLNMRARLKFVLTVHYDLLPGFQSAVDQSNIRLCLRDLDRSHLDRFVRFDDVCVRSLRAALHYA